MPVPLRFTNSMDNFNKYAGILLLTLGLFFGFILVVAILIFLLRFVSVSLFTLPGSDAVYHYLVAIVPYGLLEGLTIIYTGK